MTPVPRLPPLRPSVPLLPCPQAITHLGQRALQGQSHLLSFLTHSLCLTSFQKRCPTIRNNGEKYTKIEQQPHSIERDQGPYQRTRPRKVGLELSIKLGAELPRSQGKKENRIYYNSHYPGQAAIVMCSERSVFSQPTAGDLLLRVCSYKGLKTSEGPQWFPD